MSQSGQHWLDSWHVDASANREYDVIDGLRALAILLVVGCHLVYVNSMAGPLARFVVGIFTAGSYGVTVFFTLSGFLISWPFWKRKVRNAEQVIPSGYGWRRFWKIVPPLVLSIGLLTPVYALVTHDWSVFIVAFQWLLGLPFVAPVSGKLNTVMWSLVVEVQFYIVLPLAFLIVKKLSPKAALSCLFLGFLLVPSCFRWINAARGIYFTILPQINVHFPSMLDAFAFGILLAGLDNLGLLKRSWARLGDVGLVLLVLSLVLASWLVMYSGCSDFVRNEIGGWCIKIAAALLLFYVANTGNPRARALSHPCLRWFGIVSYEWYLFHQPIILWMRAWLGPAAGNPIKYIAVAAASVLVTLLVAGLVYRYFSLPILKRGRAKHRAERNAPIPAASVEQLERL